MPPRRPCNIYAGVGVAVTEMMGVTVNRATLALLAVGSEPEMENCGE